MLRKRLPAIAILSLVGAVACDDDTKPGGDTTTTPDGDATSSPDDGTTTGTDGTTLPDGAGDGLDGTHLEGVAVAWAEPLVLCSPWLEGATREDELAHKVRVTLPPQVRADLEATTLAAATLVGVKVERGPFTGERWDPAVVAGATLPRYAVSQADGTDLLQASVAYDLGAAGTLIEHYDVQRGDDAAGDDVDAAAGLELTFAWRPAGATGDAAGRLLAPCATPDDYEDAIALLVGTPASGSGPSSTLLRFYATRHSEISAGSYAVRLQAMQLVGSDNPWFIYEATGPWALTYVAQHHNLLEDTVVDFERDLGGWQTLFAPLAAGEQIPPGHVGRIQLDDVGLGAGTFTVTRLGADGTPSDTTFEGDAWLRVDAAHLGRALAGECSDGVVGAIGFVDYVAQLMFCPDASGPRGKRLVGVVPVYWSGEPEVAGVQVGADMIDVVGGGWEIVIGGMTMTVKPQADGAFITDVVDGSGTSVSSTYSELAALAPQTRWPAPVAATAAGGVRIDIDRRWVGQGVGESAIYGIASVRLAWGDTSRTVEDWKRIAYTNTHHNWNDELTATSDDGLVLHWKVTYDFDNGAGLVHRVWVTDADGGEVLAPTIVTPIATEE